jgi:hypothetical protein
MRKAHEGEQHKVYIMPGNFKTHHRFYIRRRNQLLRLTPPGGFKLIRRFYMEFL